MIIDDIELIKIKKEDIKNDILENQNNEVIIIYNSFNNHLMN